MIAYNIGRRSNQVKGMLLMQKVIDQLLVRVPLIELIEIWIKTNF